MTLFDLTGRVAIVTGGNGGIGLGIARGLVECGATVVVSGRDAPKSAAAVDELNAMRRRGHRHRVRRDGPEQISQLVTRTVERLGRRCRSSSTTPASGSGTARRVHPGRVQQVLNTNLTSVFLACQAAYWPMKQGGGGKIINIGSMASLFGLPYAPAYAASKGGVVQLSRALATAWAENNIQVNSILPGWISTNLTDGARRFNPDLKAAGGVSTPQGGGGAGRPGRDSLFPGCAGQRFRDWDGDPGRWWLLDPHAITGLGSLDGGRISPQCGPDTARRDRDCTKPRAWCADLL